MRKLYFFTTFLFGVIILQGQSTNYNVAEGDVLLLGPPSGQTYTAIDFPRRNTIIKRGAIANYESLIGKRVVVAALETDKKGKTIVTLKRKDGLNFFRFFPKVKADLSRAIASEELKSQGL
ncbi:hypothetical protein N9954_01580 [Maribacter sp.]|nr:hypothetical protein [Maribacter sp.]